MSATRDFAYVGSELDLFAHAANWKRYWSGSIEPYLGKRILDVGAGKGATARLLSGTESRSWLALEPDAELAACIRRDVDVGAIRGDCDVRVGTLEALDPQEVFDTILYIDVLEHIEADMAELQRAASHLSAGGRIIVLSPAHNWLFTPFDTALGHFRRYNRKTLHASTPSNLVMEKAYYLDSIGMFASLANRLLLKASSPSLRQIQFWDNWMVPVSRSIDTLTANRIGKSIVGVWRHAEPDLAKRG